ncbi:hypothetical protein SKAU_G00037450 [Synaphobranchus kaupii]|uniref:Uncharacterized protein n=1 Tax=Synaphobranchus kaupii TaxID=118154 RepID=A0A9Q1GHE4_SYNKA|nr:hypothetical protein SKAU_G00037450 [Synaphobranchus kaupii]
MLSEENPLTVWCQESHQQRILKYIFRHKEVFYQPIRETNSKGLGNSMKSAVVLICILAVGAALPTYRSKRQLESYEETQSEEASNPPGCEEDSKKTVADDSNISTTEDNQSGASDTSNHGNLINGELGGHSIVTVHLTNSEHNITAAVSDITDPSSASSSSTEEDISSSSTLSSSEEDIESVSASSSMAHSSASVSTGESSESTPQFNGAFRNMHSAWLVVDSGVQNDPSAALSLTSHGKSSEEASSSSASSSSEESASNEDASGDGDEEDGNIPAVRKQNAAPQIPALAAMAVQTPGPAVRKANGMRRRTLEPFQQQGLFADQDYNLEVFSRILNISWERMKATIVVVCLLGAVFSNPILQINILDATVTPLRGDMLEEIVRQTHTIFQTDEPVRQTSTPQPLALSSSSSESSEESDESDPDSSPENTSEDTTSEESDGNLLEMRDPDWNGDMRDDSRGSEQNIPRKWIQLFKINLRSEEDTSEETEEAESSESDSDSEASDDSDDSDGPRSMLSLCADGPENAGCNSHESSVGGEDNRMAWQRI